MNLKTLSNRIKPLLLILLIGVILLFFYFLISSPQPKTNLPHGENLQEYTPMDETEITEILENNISESGLVVEYITPNLNKPLDSGGSKMPIVIKFNNIVNSDLLTYSSYPEKDFTLINGFDQTQLILRPNTEWLPGESVRIALIDNPDDDLEYLKSPVVFDIIISMNVPELELPNIHND